MAYLDAGTGLGFSPVAPALVRHSEVYAYRDHPKAGAPSWYLPNLYGNLHARQEFELFAPLMVGDAAHTRSFIADRYIKRGRDYVVNEVLYFNADDAIVARGRTHQSFLRETENEGIVIDEKREKQPDSAFAWAKRAVAAGADKEAVGQGLLSIVGAAVKAALVRRMASFMTGSFPFGFQ